MATEDANFTALLLAVGADDGSNAVIGFVFDTDAPETRGMLLDAHGWCCLVATVPVTLDRLNRVQPGAVLNAVGGVYPSKEAAIDFLRGLHKSKYN